MNWKTGDSLLSLKSNSKFITVGKTYTIVSMLPFHDSIFKSGRRGFSIINDKGTENVVYMDNIHGFWDHFPQES